jgi:hypothetical protein
MVGDPFLSAEFCFTCGMVSRPGMFGRGLGGGEPGGGAGVV